MAESNQPGITINRIRTTAACIALLLTACSALQEEPVIDMQGVNQAQFELDKNECRSYADAADGTRAVPAGAATGGLIGGTAGAIFGNSRTAARGAGAGAITGGAHTALRTTERRQQIIMRCLQGRGYRVLG